MQGTISEYAKPQAEGFLQTGTAQSAARFTLEVKSYNSHWGWKNLTIEQ